MTDTASGSEAERLDPAIVAALFASHAAELRAYLFGLLRDSHLAEDVCQSAFAKFGERGHEASDGSLKSWLFRVAHNEAMDRRRRRSREERAAKRLAWWKREAEFGPPQTAAQSEAIERVRRALERLPDEQRQVVRLRIYEDKTFAEIAAATGKPLGTVLTRMRLATRKLADLLRTERD